MPNLRKNSIEARRHILSSRLKFSNESQPFKGIMSSILPKHAISRIKGFNFFGKPSPKNNPTRTLEEDSFISPLNKDASIAEIKPFDDSSPAFRYDRLPPIRPKRLESFQLLPSEKHNSQTSPAPILVESFNETSRYQNSPESSTKITAEQQFIDCFKTIDKKQQTKVYLLLNDLMMCHHRAANVQSSDQSQATL